jgi:hypothetical protein
LLSPLPNCGNESLSVSQGAYPERRPSQKWKSLFHGSSALDHCLSRFGNSSFQTRPEYYIKWDSLQRIYGDVGPHEFVLRPQLTHLDISNRVVSYRQVVDIFKGCPKLIWLSLFILIEVEPPDVPASTIILHDLSFVSFEADHLSAIYQLVSLPSLREIYISRHSPSDDPGTLRSLLSLLTRSVCTLKKLEIRGMPSPQDLVQILAHSSCNLLTSLSISQYRASERQVTDEVLRILTLHHDNSACTHLKFLSLTCRAGVVSMPALLKMVESRIGSRTGKLQDELLHNLHLQITDDRTIDYEQALDKIIKRSEMECDRSSRFYGHIYSIHLRRFGAHVPAHDFFGT